MADSLLRALPGIVFLLLVGVLFSTDRRRISLRVVLAGLACHVLIGALILFVPLGRMMLNAASMTVNHVLGYGTAGISFVFGDLVSPEMGHLFPDGGFIFGLRVLPQIIYISALIGILYYFGIMQALARLLGGLVQIAIGTSRIESFSAVTTIFLGQSEMPVALKPYVPKLTRPELFTVMCSGTSSVAGSVLAGYAGLGVPIDYLLAASFMAIPGGLLFAKLLMPSNEVTRIVTLDVPFEEKRPVNIFEAISVGTTNGLHVAVAVGAMLIAFIGLIACVNGVLELLGGWFGFPQMSLEIVLGFAFAPLAWLIGVPWVYANGIGIIIGQKVVFNEFVAFIHLSSLIRAHALPQHVIAIASFALCGFANLSSIGILLAGYGAVCPERRAEVAAMGLRAVLAGTLSNLLSATVAGIFIS